MYRATDGATDGAANGAAGVAGAWVGCDVVWVTEFARQLTQPGSTFVNAFTLREQRDASASPAGRDASLAARWAAKEAFIKAWDGVGWGLPPSVRDAWLWRDVEVQLDAWRRPKLSLSGVLGEQFGAQGLAASLSLSHDGDYALATVLVSRAQTGAVRFTSTLRP